MSFLKKMSTSVARAKQVAMVKIGQSDSTVDPHFVQLEGQFKEQFSKMKKLGKYVQGYQAAVKDLGAAQKGMSQMIIEQYDTSDSMYHTAVQLNENIIGQIESYRIRMEQHYNENFHMPLTQYLGQYKIIEERIIARNTRVVDMDRYNADLKALMSKPDTDPTRLQIMKEKAEYKRRDYETLNEELIKDIPLLLNDRSRFFDGLFANVVNGKAMYFADAARALGLLSPNFQHVNKAAASSWPFSITEPSKSAYEQAGTPFPEGTATNATPSAPPSAIQSFAQQPVASNVPNTFGQAQIPQQIPIQQQAPVQQQQQAPPMAQQAPVAQQQQQATPQGKRARTLFPFQGQDDTELTFGAGEMMMVTNQSGDWWVGEMNGKRGYFPSNYVTLC